jgi:uncharacterized membrane protein YcfT
LFSFPSPSSPFYLTHQHYKTLSNPETKQITIYDSVLGLWAVNEITDDYDPAIYMRKLWKTMKKNFSLNHKSPSQDHFQSQNEITVSLKYKFYLCGVHPVALFMYTI